MLEKHPMKLTLTLQDLLNEVVPVLIATEESSVITQINSEWIYPNLPVAKDVDVPRPVSMYTK